MIDFFEAPSLLARRPPSAPADDAADSGRWEGHRHFAEPYYVTGHAVQRFKERVLGTRAAALSDRAIINLVQAELQRRRLVVEPRFRTRLRAYACTYREQVGEGTKGNPSSAKVHEVPFYALVDPRPDKSEPGPDGRVWPQVVTIKGEGSALHAKLSGNARLIDKHGPAFVVRQPTLVGELAPYWHRYTEPGYQAAMRPLRVVLGTAGVVAGYDPPTFDGLLARLVVDEALGDPAGSHGLDGGGAPYLLPVPLRRLWTCPDSGLPLWAANHLAPAGPGDGITVYWHKRIIRPEHARDQNGPHGRQATPYAIKGRYKEKRVPLPARTETLWWADCIGDAAEIRRLLGGLYALGKKRMAVVTGVAVEPLEGAFRMSRPVPVTYFDAGTPLTGHVYRGWTPPYWPGVPECHAECAVPEHTQSVN